MCVCRYVCACVCMDIRTHTCPYTEYLHIHPPTIAFSLNFSTSPPRLLSSVRGKIPPESFLSETGSSLQGATSTGFLPSCPRAGGRARVSSCPPPPHPPIHGVLFHSAAQGKQEENDVVEKLNLFLDLLQSYKVSPTFSPFVWGEKGWATAGGWKVQNRRVKE